MKSIEEHLRYAAITDADVLSLREAKFLAEAHSEQFIARFYEHLQSFNGTNKFLSDDALIKRLLDAQKLYLLSLFEARFDAVYYEHRCNIGRVHFRIGLEFQWYVGAYRLYLDFFIPVFASHYAGEPDKLRALRSAYDKVLLMDMSIVLESFHREDRATLEAANNKVLRQEKLASVGLLTSGLAHEIGNPLASIVALCDGQLRKCKDETAVARFGDIRKNALRIVKIVGQLVNYARPTPAVWTKVNLNESVTAALEIAKLARQRGRVDVKLNLAPDSPVVDGLGEQLSQVFLNLMINAFDAINLGNGDGGGILEISTVTNKIGATVTVRDNGHGIKSENLARVFEPFFTTKDVGKGTGLGLHVCMCIVNSHNGTIKAESEPGKGAVFTVFVPWRQEGGAKKA